MDDYSEIEIYHTDPMDPSDDGTNVLPARDSFIILHTYPINITKGEGKLFTCKGNVTSSSGKGLWLVSVKIYITDNLSTQEPEFSLACSHVTDPEG